MLFVYLLALIGLASLIAGCALGVQVWLAAQDHPDVLESDPQAEALASVERIQAAMWESAQRLDRVEREER
jgi:hypothetical protein